MTNRTIKTVEAVPGAYATEFINVATDKVEFPNGVEGQYSVISTSQPCGAVIVPIAIRRGLAHFGLVEQYRYPIKSFTLEFPRGGADNISSEGAAIEIREELGEDALRIENVGTVFADTGLLSTPVTVWVALMDADNIDRNHREDITGLEPQWMLEGDLIGKIANGDVRCGLTLASYALFNINRWKFSALLDDAMF